jgi:hypothetical protein
MMRDEVSNEWSFKQLWKKAFHGLSLRQLEISDHYHSTAFFNPAGDTNKKSVTIPIEGHWHAASRTIQSKDLFAL